MNKQIKSTLIQIVVGASVVIVGLMALNKFVPTFTLFPETLPEQEVVEDGTQDGQSNMQPQADEAEPADLPSSNDSFIEEEEETAPVNNVPENVTANKMYSSTKRLKANNLGIYAPRELFKNVKSTVTNYLHSEYCPENVEGYKQKIGIYYTLSRDDLLGTILFVAVKTKKNTYFFKPQAGNNLLEIPNNFSKGEHEIEYGYVLKNDVTKRKIPFYSKKCVISIED